MGRDYHILGRDDGGGRTNSSSNSKLRKKTKYGCMAAFYHLFDFHHHLTIDSSPSSSKGKALKLVDQSPPSTTYKDKQQRLNIPVRTETYTTGTRLRDLKTDACTFSSEICNSPESSNTPSLVARLMGLDLLPVDNHSLHSNSHRLSKTGTRLGTKSLPASPRISSSRKSDFDIHRLSLQLNKENKHDEMKQDQEENRSPRYYARQMVKQIKEKVVTRRAVGTDITNSVKKRDARTTQNTSNEVRRDSTVSCSPRSRFSDKENTNSSSSFRPEHNTQKPKPKPTTVILLPMSKASEEKQKQNQKRVKQRQLRPINQCKKVESETRFSPPPIKQRQREGFLSEPRDFKAKHSTNSLDKNKFKKIPKSISATGPSHKKVTETEGLMKWHEDASICSNGPQVSASFSITSEKDYITRIINLAGINTDSAVSSETILDLSIFSKLEHLGENPSGTLALRCNRMLLFDLVNEILISTMELHAKRRRSYHGSELIGKLCSAVASSVSVEVNHLLETKKLEEEEEGVIAEIERDITEALVGETALELVLTTRRIQTT